MIKTVYHCAHSFFDEIDSETKAYWLGFIAADGCITGNALQVTLSSSDRAHLHRLKADLNSDHPIKDSTPSGSPRSYEGTEASSRLYIRSSRLTDALKDHGIMPRKTFQLRWPDFLPDELLRHYLRGYFDGDGSFSVTRGSYVRKRDGERLPALRWQIAGTKVFCLGAQEYLQRVVGTRRVQLYRPPNSPNIRTLNYGGVLQVSRIYKLLYEGATIYLPRKRETVRPYVRSGYILPDTTRVDRKTLWELRKKRRMSAEELATRAGISASTVSILETGKAPARAFTIVKIAEALAVDPCVLVDEGSALTP